ncbi:MULTISPECIES: hypothetical protein [Alcaligenes]|jgi:hypothetical protein|uniref:Lipoprotein n=1 Tax=Alcaligenes ammonioxydans TaxID=2582914 RepID=A0ABX8SRB3_9BURK|nr:hypothetical protein [Alcaligenes ammonioxydans]EJC62468.1 hypothetical protein QWA_08671 [Alcaligenes faecalis subsp. faecalis NCIB 8687]QBH20465.1 hypothetical protein EYC51_13670 [Alcaligenes faecalis]QXX78540.1 hypothetical protein FE795_05565 [Alcaligenes ammonioxydans]WGQ36657.1 hypothetical protein QEZ63_05770 [Alcaligenes faecalis]HRK85034.1 hypothetical protein [Alcaligenes faecalis]
MKKIILALAGLAVLAGCAKQNAELREQDLRRSSYFKTERRINMDFVAIQRALFKHQAECGKAAVFKMDERQASYGTLRYELEPGAGWEKSILVDLTLMQKGWVDAKVYSYSGNVKKEINEIFTSLRAPGVCNPEDAPKEVVPEDDFVPVTPL